MAEFLTTTGTSHHIEQIIIKAKSTLTLVTPYLKLSKTLTERLTDADKAGVIITIIYGKNELAKNEYERITAFKNLQLYFCENLHAKCYHNEETMIVTSMNLYEFSEKNNREMGILVERENDRKIFEESIREIDSIKNASVLKKTFETSQQKNIDYDSLIKFYPRFNDENNFHIPSLHKILQAKYPKSKIELDQSLILHDFPFQDCFIDISYRIELYAKERDKDLFDAIRYRNEGWLDKHLVDFRLFWNYYYLGIYRELGFKPQLDNDGLKSHVSKILKIVDIIHDKLREPNTF